MYHQLTYANDDTDGHGQIMRAWAIQAAIDVVSYVPSSPKTLLEVARVTVILERYIRTGELVENNLVMIPHPKKFTAAG